MRVLLFGNYPTCVGYTRNRVVVQAMRTAGIECIEAQVPLFQDASSRKRAASSPWRLMGLGGRVAYQRRELKQRYRAAAGNFDLVYVGYGGIGDQSLARSLDRRRSVPLVVDAFLSLYETVVEDRKLCGAASLRARYLRRLDRRIAERADLALVDTPQTARYLSELTGLALARWHALPVGSELPLTAPPPKHSTLRGLFVGTGVPLHGTTVLLRAMAQIEERRVPLRLTFVGGTAADRNLARELCLRGVQFIDRFVDAAELATLHGGADFACGVFDAGAKAARVVPCKIYDALACGRAVVTADTPAVRELVGAGAALHLVPAGDASALADRLEQLTRCDLVGAGAAARAVFEERFAVRVLGEHLREVFAALIAARRPSARTAVRMAALATPSFD